MLPDPCDRWCRVWKKMSKSGCILVQNSGHIIIGLHYNSYTGISWKLQVLAYKFLMKETNKGKQNLWHLKCAGMHYMSFCQTEEQDHQPFALQISDSTSRTSYCFNQHRQYLRYCLKIRLNQIVIQGMSLWFLCTFWLISPVFCEGYEPNYCSCIMGSW